MKEEKEKSRTIQVRLSPEELLKFDELKSNYQKMTHNPGASNSEVARYAIRLAASAPVCPYCDSALVEKLTQDEDAAPLGVWYCPECASGSVAVMVHVR